MTTSGDIVVRRCAVRVVRHGGWSWGPQPRHLVDQVLAALPNLIAGQLGDLAPDGGPDREITEPVRIVVSLTLADLLAGRFEPLRRAAVTTGPLPAPSSVAELTWPKPAVGSSRPPGRGQTPAIPADRQVVTLAEFLGRLLGRGELTSFLALLPPETLEAWYQMLATAPAATAGTPRTAVSAAPAADLAHLGDAVHTITGRPDLTPATASAAETDRARRLRDTIVALVASASRRTASGPSTCSDPAAGPPVGQALAESAAARPRYPPGEVTAGTVTARAASAVIAAAGEQILTATAAGTITPTAPQSTSASDADISSALPFLLLGPLAQIGYLSAIAPVLEPVGLQAQTAVFATALAYTVLGPLARGWRREPEDVAAASAFAGLSAPVPGSALTEFARVVGPALPALDAVVTRALAEGHTAGEPLVLTSAEGRAGGLLLLDRDGLFPVAWTDTIAGLLPAWRMCGSPPVLVSPTALGALRGLAAAGATFVVAAPPGRGERWRRLPHRLWTNDDENPALARHASGYREAVDLAAELIKALAGERAAVPLATGPALGRSLLLAAGLGLGTLAWTLWREREPVDPLLALERFADLSARVSFEPHRVRVRLPLGPRHADLSAHGLLADVRGVPWFGGRVVEFSGG